MGQKISPAQAGERWGIATTTVRDWITKGLLTAYRAGPRLIRIDTDELDALMAPARPEHTPRAEWAEHVRKLIAQAPPLSPEQIDRLMVLLSAQPQRVPVTETEARTEVSA